MLDDSVRRLHRSIDDLRVKALVFALRKGSSIPLTPMKASALLAADASLIEAADSARRMFQPAQPEQPIDQWRTHTNGTPVVNPGPREVPHGRTGYSNFKANLAVIASICLGLLIVECVAIKIITKHMVEFYSFRFFAYLAHVLGG